MKILNDNKTRLLSDQVYPFLKIIKAQLLLELATFFFILFEYEAINYLWVKTAKGRSDESDTQIFEVQVTESP